MDNDCLPVDINFSIMLYVYLVFEFCIVNRRYLDSYWMSFLIHSVSIQVLHVSFCSWALKLYLLSMAGYQISGGNVTILVYSVGKRCWYQATYSSLWRRQLKCFSKIWPCWWVIFFQPGICISERKCQFSIKSFGNARTWECFRVPFILMTLL